MAGAGYKLFNTGDVLTAAQVNTYLQEQTVMVFANSTARTTALSGVLAEGMMSYLQDTNAVEVYNGSAWVGVSGAGDVTEVQAGTGISVASGTGPIPVVTNTMATEITAAGDIVVGTGSGTFDNLPIGSTGQVLTADTTVSPYKVKWAAAAAGGGKVLQVVTGTTTTNFTTSSTAYGDTNLSATITPSSATSKVLVLVSQQYYMYRAASEMAYGLRVVRGATTVYTMADIAYIQTSSGTRGDLMGTSTIIYMDSPSTTSATTYKTQGNVTYTTSSAGVSIQDGSKTSTITLLEIGA